MNTDFKPFSDGQLCYVVLRKYAGKGTPKLIMHEAKLTEGGFGYGAFRTWVISPSSLMGMSKSRKKATSSRANGKKGGRPKYIPDPMEETPQVDD